MPGDKPLLPRGLLVRPGKKVASREFDVTRLDSSLQGSLQHESIRESRSLPRSPNFRDLCNLTRCGVSRVHLNLLAFMDDEFSDPIGHNHKEIYEQQKRC
jgi:hypothetical protein